MDLRDTPRGSRLSRRGARRGSRRTSRPTLSGPRSSEEEYARAWHEWSRKLADAGYAGLTWPKEYGGSGAPYPHQAIFLEETARAEAPQHMNVIGLGMAGPTIIAHGTEEQKARYLPKILSAEEIWCQGFSEPGAGSDLASARTSARLEGDHFVVDGQKVWSSFAHVADWCILVTRSDPESEKHAGLTYMLVDMHSPGVEVRPLRQITGEAEFNEIFFTGVEVPVENVLGEVGQGWGGRDDDAAARARHARVRADRDARGQRAQAAHARPRARRRRSGSPGPRRARVDRAARAAADELPGADDADEDRHARPRGLRLQADVVGVEPAADEARARDPRPRRAALERRRARLLAVPAAPQPRQHDRGRHVGDPPQHHRRARARPPEER